jgi:hypothetical protein
MHRTGFSPKFARKFLPALFAATIACSPAPDHSVQSSTKESKQTIGILHEDLGKLFFAPDALPVLLKILQATEIRDGVYSTSQSDPEDGQAMLTFTAEEMNDPEYYLEIFNPMESGTSKLLLIHQNARCGQVHPGFVSPCMGTFGIHQRFGQSMTWKVQPWKSCTDGDTLCIERLKIVGSIEYYPTINCVGLDSNLISRPIRRMRCD